MYKSNFGGVLLSKDKFCRLNRITHFDGLYGEAGPRPDGEYLFSELLETRSEHFEWKIKPHIHTNLYQLFLMETRRTEFLGCKDTTWLTGSCILMIPPLAVHGFNYSPQTKGRILTISDKLVSNICHAPMLSQLQIISNFSGDYNFKHVMKMVEELHEELFSMRQDKQQMLTVLLQRLFLVLGRIWREQEQVVGEPDSVSLRHYRKFQKKVSEHGSRYTIERYAKELGITTVHLNRVCNAVVGKSAHLLLQEYLVEEAKKQLRYTSYSVSEVAYLLNFEYPNYFARFFKKMTGMSPGEYRKL